MSTDTPIKAAVVGFGVIGRRVAEAVRLQTDMALIGVVADLRIWPHHSQCAASTRSRSNLPYRNQPFCFAAMLWPARMPVNKLHLLMPRWSH